MDLKLHVGFMELIRMWLNFINSDMKRIDIIEGLKEVYRTYKPYIAGIVFTGYCPDRCCHCIYPPDFSRYNQDISFKHWKRILKDIYDGLGVKIFIHNGRSLDKKGIESLRYIKTSLPKTKVGIIDNGISIIPFIDKLASMELDWIDISLDGMELDHDFQRRKKGAFKRALETLLELKEKEVAPKVNVLTCLTTINKGSITGLISFLNEKGFNNFFVSPVSVVQGYRPSETLKVSSEDFRLFIEELLKIMETLEDVEVHVDLFEAEYMHFVKGLNKSIWTAFQCEYDHLVWKEQIKQNELFINYFPLSLNGIRELIVNCDGNVLVPKSMAKGRIPEDEISGSLLSKSSSKIVKELPNSQSFAFYINELFMEKALLGKGR